MGRLEAALRQAGVNCGVPRRLGAAEAGCGSAQTPAHSVFEWAAAFETRVTDWRSAAGRWTRPRCTSDSREEGGFSTVPYQPLFKMAFIYVFIYLPISLCAHTSIRRRSAWMKVGRTARGNRFSPSSLWVPGTELIWSGLAASDFYLLHAPPHFLFTSRVPLG